MIISHLHCIGLLDSIKILSVDSESESIVAIAPGTGRRHFTTGSREEQAGGILINNPQNESK